MTSIKHRTAALLLAAFMGAAGAFVATAISADEAHAIFGGVPTLGNTGNASGGDSADIGFDVGDHSGYE